MRRSRFSSKINNQDNRTTHSAMAHSLWGTGAFPESRVWSLARGEGAGRGDLSPEERLVAPLR